VVIAVARKPANSTRSRSSRKEAGFADVVEPLGVVVVAGPGGVGKTTLAASIGLGMARRGRKVAVVTIDPAKRLATALGVDRLENTPSRVSPSRLAKAGVEPASGGELWAMTLDSRRTFDDLIGRLAPDASTRDQILSNRIYREISGAVAGSQEFTAVAKLHELEEDGSFDLIVLDTPPSRNALDFLDAPGRLSRFFDGRAIQIIMRPAGFGMRLAGGGANIVAGVLKRITGATLFSDLADFFTAINGVTAGFTERAKAVAELLAAPSTGYVIVAAPEPGPVTEAVTLAQALRERGLTPLATVANRVHLAPGASRRSVRTASARESLGDDLSMRLADAVSGVEASAARDAEGVAELEAGVGAGEAWPVSAMEGEVHDISGLVRIESALFGE